MPSHGKARPRLNRKNRLRKQRATLRLSAPALAEIAPSRPRNQSIAPNPASSGRCKPRVRSVTILPSHLRVRFVRVPASSSSSSGRLDFSKRYDDLEPLASRGNLPPTPRKVPDAPLPGPPAPTTPDKPFDFLVPHTPTGPLPPTPGKWLPSPSHPSPSDSSSSSDDDVIILDDIDMPSSDPRPQLHDEAYISRRTIPFSPL